MRNAPGQYSYATQQALSQFMSQVYMWMVIGLGISGGIAYYVQQSTLFNVILGNPLLFYGIIILQLAVVIIFSFMQQKLSASTTTMLYLLYSVLTGVTFSVVLYAYTQHEIVLAFATTAGAFFGLSVFGFATKRDLGPVGSFCMMGLFGLIIVSVIAMFVPGMREQTWNLTIATIGVVVFAGLTAYHTQRIKQAYALTTEADRKKLVISSALMLYLDFINLFISLLRLFGGGRR